MLVDLERNDLGRVCRFGSVHVDEYMADRAVIPTSANIVSHISGALKPDATSLRSDSSAVPGGTITGVPKIRCMEIIEELEPVRRGPYTGSFGYISWNGDLDLNIVDSNFGMVCGKGILAKSVPGLLPTRSGQGIRGNPPESASVSSARCTIRNNVDLSQ